MEFSELYNEQDKQILKDAEDALNPRIDRVNEIVEYARQANIKAIGIANCITFNIKNILSDSKTSLKENYQIEKAFTLHL